MLIKSWMIRQMTATQVVSSGRRCECKCRQSAPEVPGLE